jgi:hypothetical protein
VPEAVARDVVEQPRCRQWLRRPPGPRG